MLILQQITIAKIALENLLLDKVNKKIQEVFYLGESCDKKDYCFLQMLFEELQTSITDEDYLTVIFEYLNTDLDFLAYYDEALANNKNTIDACDDCCEGLGEMIINAEDCDSFEIGPCGYTEVDCETTQVVEEQIICEQII